jgi:glutathione S-transferase
VDVLGDSGWFHFVKYNKGKAPYAEERYFKEAHRLYSVLDRRLAQHEFVAGTTPSPTSLSGHGSRATNGRLLNAYADFITADDRDAQIGKA